MPQEDDALQGEISRFIEASSDALGNFLHTEVDRWMYRALCYHSPGLFSGDFAVLPLTAAQSEYIADHCMLRWNPHGLAGQEYTLLLDNKPIAMLRYVFKQPAITVQYNCKGLLT